MDGKPKKISLVDIVYSYYHFHQKQWKEESWGEELLNNNPNFTLSNLHYLGNLLNDSKTSKLVKKRVQQLFQSLVKYLESPSSATHDRIFYFANKQEPKIFSEYFRVSLKAFLEMNEQQKSLVFENSIKKKFPDPSFLKYLSFHLTRPEQYLFMKACFKINPLSSFPLFEKANPYFRPEVKDNSLSMESKFFPNLPQDTPYNKRQKFIDHFLGTPVSYVYKGHFRSGNTPIKTTIKKFIWKYNTEVFSIESENPGPTTLVFSPHFHENNPRKHFHWTQNIPLQSGRIILIPEANQTMRKICKDTNPMNGLFNKAFLHQRRDSFLVRRIEYLMGLVDGMVGLHDSHKGPFFISDVIKNHRGGKTIDPNPTPSPWIPQMVRKIKKINPPQGKYTRIINKITPPQTQWQIAQFAFRKMEKLTGAILPFEPEWILSERSGSTRSSTGYMNYYLGKPAMTFEGKKGEEHGQLHAMALYSLLLGFGHRIDPIYEKSLKKPIPNIAPLYVGLPVNRLPSPSLKPQPKKLNPHRVTP